MASRDEVDWNVSAVFDWKIIYKIRTRQKKKKEMTGSKVVSLFSMVRMGLMAMAMAMAMAMMMIMIMLIVGGGCC